MTRRLRTLAQAARWVERAGFALLFPIKGLRLPSLWAAVKGRPPRGFKLDAEHILVEWDADAERLWGWKDELPRRRLAYYGKFFRQRGTLISPAFLACFYRLAGNPGRSDDHERLYRAGKISAEAVAICRELLRHGPQGPMELRQALGWSSRRANARFKRALLELQCRLLICHFGAKLEGAAWPSAVYELLPRAFPRVVRAAAQLSEDEARRRLLAHYRALVPGATPRDAARLFGWPRAKTETRNSKTETR